MALDFCVFIFFLVIATSWDFSSFFFSSSSHVITIWVFLLLDLHKLLTFSISGLVCSQCELCVQIFIYYLFHVSFYRCFIIKIAVNLVLYKEYTLYISGFPHSWCCSLFSVLGLFLFVCFYVFFKCDFFYIESCFEFESVLCIALLLIQFTLGGILHYIFPGSEPFLVPLVDWIFVCLFLS